MKKMIAAAALALVSLNAGANDVAKSAKGNSFSATGPDVMFQFCSADNNGLFSCRPTFQQGGLVLTMVQYDSWMKSSGCIQGGSGGLYHCNKSSTISQSLFGGHSSVFWGFTDGVSNLAELHIFIY